MTKNVRKRTAEFVTSARTLEKHIELELSIKHFLHSVQVAVRKRFIRKLQDPGGVGVAGSGALIRLEGGSGVFNDILHNVLCISVRVNSRKL